MKKLFKILIAVALVVVIALFAAAPFIGSKIKKEVETQGSQMAQAEIKLGDIDVCIICGEVKMSNVFIGNPEGFKADSAFKLGEANVVVDLKSIMEDVLVIKEIKILQPEITYEVGLLGSNVGKIQKNIEKAIGSNVAKSSKTREVADSSEGKKIIIETLIIEEAKVKLGAYAAGEGDDYDITIPEIKLTNIGKDEGGIDKAEVAEIVIGEINKELIKQGGAGAVVNKVKGWFN